MFRFRFLIIMFVAWLFMILSFERIVNQTNFSTLSIAPFVYVLVMATAAFAILYLPNHRLPNYGLILFMLAIYTPAKALSVWLNYIGDMNAFVASLALEITVLLSANILILSLTNWFYQYNESLKSAIFSPISSQIDEKYQNTNIIEQRIAAARRYEREPTLLFIQFDKAMSSKLSASREQESDAGNILFHMRMAELLSFLSPNSVKAWNQNDLMVCVPFDVAKNHQLAEQIQEVFTNVLKVNVNVKLAAFPQDGLVLEDLIQTAKRKA